MRTSAQAVFAELRTLIRGSSTAMAALLVYSLLNTALSETTRLNAVPISVLAYAMAMIVSFVGHKYFTFGTTGNFKAQLLKFVALHCVCLLVTASITELVVNRLGWPYGLGILLVDIVVPFLSYVALRLVVFEDRSGARLLRAPDIKRML